ncbi:glycoside hydrolase family 2 TIM barrel-domain containing protein [uncultured Draconibacterium sp.]|mgnify:CR=1 FL=1|uniref:glycoside hydrolase family 2 TIM barrel-domain containing protein n=1 Tax=uncultured Draconibacterium sp. TaxID=1573823 RepID=UPI0025F3F7BB|nr:glycoside hydrolase family 2 TIM barrel-domain containing protein [uncultured Draconibacterium sp.]
MFSCTNSPKENFSKRTRLFNDDWKFIRDSIGGAEKPDFDDSNWMTVDLPHDFSIMDLSGEDSDDQVGPFSKKAPGNGNGTGHTMGGTGWYRKNFVLNKADRGKMVALKFDGAYMETEVWVNGKKAGFNKNGYTPFYFDISSLLNPAGDVNSIAVKVDNIGANSRWYSGSGLYRNVHLIVTNPVHVSVWGTKITTSEITSANALVDVEVIVQNGKEEAVGAELTINIKDMEGSIMQSSTQIIDLSAKSEKIAKAQINVESPSLWSIESPNLYEAEVVVNVDNKASDVYTQHFGIRSIEFSAEKGFLLNGKQVLINGGCLHHDNGYLGAAAFERAERRKVELMKANGYNAIRTSHNPFSEVFLNACDELGILVIDEFTDMWENYKHKNDYSRFFSTNWENDLSNMIRRDRNHPSIIMWSIGNEIPKKNITDGVRIGKMLVEKVKELDNTRPTTEGVPSFLIHGGWKNAKNYFELLDVAGYNYMEAAYESDHKEHPERVIYSSESYPKEAYKYWKAVEKLPYVIGDFVWTTMDYIGEVHVGNSTYKKAEDIDHRAFQTMDGIPEGTNPDLIYNYMNQTPSTWPAFISWCGDLDLMGDKKPQGLYRDVLWDLSPIEVNVHELIPEGYVEDISLWGWPRELSVWDWKGSEGKPLQVRVFTKASQVKLELNGQPIGEQIIGEDDKYVAVFEVPYEPGELTAIALSDGKEIARKTLSTPGDASAIRLTADRKTIRADRNDLAYVKIEMVDKNGQVIVQDPAKLKIDVSGNGELIGSGNADPSDMASVNNSEVNTFRGKAQAIIRPFSTSGEIAISVSSDSLTSGEIKIIVE